MKCDFMEWALVIYVSNFKERWLLSLYLVHRGAVSFLFSWTIACSMRLSLPRNLHITVSAHTSYSSCVMMDNCGIGRQWRRSLREAALQSSCNPILRWFCRVLKSKYITEDIFSSAEWEIILIFLHSKSLRQKWKESISWLKTTFYHNQRECSLILVRLEKKTLKQKKLEKQRQKTPRTRFTLAGSQICRRVQQPGQDTPSAAAGREWQ